MLPLLFQSWTKILFGRTTGLFCSPNSLVTCCKMVCNLVLAITTIETWNIMYINLWCDVLCSTFTEIFDVDWFISFLSKDVKIVKEVPRKDGKIVTAPYRMRIPRKCTPRCYEKRVLPILLKKHVSVHFSIVQTILLKTSFMWCWYFEEACVIEDVGLKIYQPQCVVFI